MPAPTVTRPPTKRWTTNNAAVWLAEMGARKAKTVGGATVYELRDGGAAKVEALGSGQHQISLYGSLSDCGCA